MENLNLVELLRDCPTGMDLDCTVFDNVTFDYVNTQQNRVYCKVNKSESVWFTSKGGVNLLPDAKCVIFPKGKTTWEGFQKSFKDGDVCYIKTETLEFIFIFKNTENHRYIGRYVNLVLDHLFTDKTDDAIVCNIGSVKEFRFATKEEKKKLFDAIKATGYKWNDETKTLEKKQRKLDIKTCLNCKTFNDMHQNCPYSPIYTYKDLNEAKSHLSDETNCKFWTEISKTNTLEKLPTQKSKISWHTGIPENLGFYLVTLSDGRVSADIYLESTQHWDRYSADKIVAWCPVDEIEPYNHN